MKHNLDANITQRGITTHFLRIGGIAGLPKANNDIKSGHIDVCWSIPALAPDPTLTLSAGRVRTDVITSIPALARAKKYLSKAGTSSTCITSDRPADVDKPKTSNRPELELVKTLLLPAMRLVAQNLFLAVLPSVAAVSLILDGRRYGAVPMIALALFFLRDLGFVVVQPGRITSYRLFRLPRQAETPHALACDVNMIRRKVLRFVPAVTYWYPAIVLDTGKTISLPIATKSRDKVVHTASLLRVALQIPINGQELVPKGGRIARTFAGTKASAGQPEFGSDEWLKDQWS